MSKGKVIAAVLAVVVVVVGASVAVALGSQSSGVEVSVEQVTEGALSVTVTASGKVEADEQGDIYPPTAGTLASIVVTEGQVVKKSDLIAVLDTASLELQVAQAQAAYEGALAQADAVNKTAPSSADNGAASAAVSAAYAAYEAADAQYEAAKSAVPSQAAIDQAQLQIDQAQATYDAAVQAYDDFIDAHPAPRDATTEAALVALGIVRNQAYTDLLSAQATLAQLVAAQNNDAAVAAAKIARDQAWAGYLAALAQQSQLTKASSTGAARSAADAAVETARLVLDLAIENLGKAELRAPMDGTVVFNSATGGLSALGGTASGKPTVGSSVSPASPPFSVVYFDQLLFSAQVDEADISKVEEGQSVAVTLDAVPGETFETTVERIEKTAVLTSTGGTAFSVLMRLKDVGDKALLGMNGSVDIEISSIDSAIAVPIEAVLDDADGSYVFLIRGGKAERVSVVTGTLTDTRAQILKGVAVGDDVAVSGLTDLEDGASVKVQ
ncbi:MAG: efflux RND transporter periplasmic adaptor subunit [Coriobacteriia bacterium]|nr:efflux RND transporter periplasmic adaptor subunit [Coriobacteriia bacterium]